MGEREFIGYGVVLVRKSGLGILSDHFFALKYNQYSLKEFLRSLDIGRRQVIVSAFLKIISKLIL
jgi:hypothetical protein